MCAAGQQQSGARVSEIVPAYIGQPGALEQGLEAAVHDVLSIERSSLAGSKDESLILVQRPDL